MPTSSETEIAYVPRTYDQVDENGVNPSARSVTEINTNVEHLVDVAPPKQGLSRLAKVLIAVGVIAALAVVAIVLGVVLSRSTTTTTTSTRTTTTATTTTATTSTATTATTTTATTTTSVTTTTTETTTTSVTTLATAPGNMMGYRGNINQTYTFILTGSNSGGIWGTTIYTDDSNVAVAAVHAGFAQLNQNTVVTVMILDGQSGYASTTQNGITSSGWGGWGGSYSFVSVGG